MDAAKRGNLAAGTVRWGISSRRTGSHTVGPEHGPTTSTRARGSSSRARRKARPTALSARSKQSTETFTRGARRNLSAVRQLGKQRPALGPGAESGVGVDVAGVLESHQSAAPGGGERGRAVKRDE